MYLIYSLAISGFIIGIIIGLFSKKGEKKVTLIIAPIVFTIVGLICGFTLSTIFQPDIERITKKEQIYSLKDNVKSCIFINDKYFNFYSRDLNEESIQLKEASIYRSKVKFTSGQPYVEIKYNKLKNNEYNKIFIIKNSVYEDCSYLFYIPKGSITSDYKLDSE